MSATTLPLEQAMPGMVLASDVLDAHGAILLTAGSELGESQLASLRRRGVPQVTIAGGQALSEEEMAARAVAVRTRLDHLFRGDGRGEPDHLLYQTLLEFRLEQLG
jgi:hypothetical protein